MTYKIFPITAFLIIWVFNLQSQTKIDPINLDLADNLKEQYEDKKFAAIYMSTLVTFTIDEKIKDRWPVKCTETEKSSLIALENHIEFSNAVFYDDYSSVTDINIYNSKGKKQKIMFLDRSYESDGIFHSDARYKTYGYDVENKGSQFSYLHKVDYDDVKYFSSLYFQDFFPVMERQIEIRVPKWLDLEILEFNFEEYSVKKTITADKKGDYETIVYTVKDLEPRQYFNKSPGPSHYMPHLIFVYKSYEMDGKKHKMFASTADLYNWYRQLRNNVENETAEISELAAGIVKGASNEKEKIEALYYWVQDNIRYIAFEDGIAGFQPEPCQQVYNKKYGDCKGMANLLAELLKSQGFDARLTWIGTRRLNYDYTIPSLIVDNHMICTLFLEGETYYLDGTEKYMPFGSSAFRIQGQEVLIEDGENYLIKKIPEKEYESNRYEHQIHYTLDGKQLNGSAKYQINGEGKTRLLNIYNSTPKNEQKQALEDYLSGYEKNVSVEILEKSGLNNRNLPIDLEFNISVNNQIIETGDEIYVNMDFEQVYKNSDISEERSTDLELTQKIFYNYEIKLNFPTGFIVDYLPDPVKINEPEYTFNANYTQLGNSILLNKQIIIKNAWISKENFDSWNIHINELSGFYKDRVILKKQ